MQMAKNGTLYILNRHGVFESVPDRKDIGAKRYPGGDDTVRQFRIAPSGRIWTLHNDSWIKANGKKKWIGYKEIQMGKDGTLYIHKGDRDSVFESIPDQPSIAAKRFRGITKIWMPGREIQSMYKNDCGPVAGARLASAYGVQMSVAKVADEVLDSVDSAITKKLRLGTKPGSLESGLGRLGLRYVEHVNQFSLKNVKHLLQTGRPVIALIRPGKSKKLHYIVLSGIDTVNSKIFYMDSDGREYFYTYNEFFQKWEWNFGPLDALLRVANVRSRTLVVVNGPPARFVTRK